MKKTLAALIGVAALAFFLGRRSTPEPAHEQDHKHEHADDGVWTCAMHAQIRAGGPGPCPICGMDLVLANTSDDVAEESPGLTLSPRARALARLKTAVVKRSASGQRPLRLLGRIEAAETRREVVTSWVSGRIERLRVTSAGQRVRRGQVVADVYSPEVHAAERALQINLQGDAPAATVRATERRLELLGVSRSEIASISERSKPRATVPVRARRGGVVLEHEVAVGDVVSAGTTILELADLSVVWVALDAYERDLPLLSKGQQAQLLIEGSPREMGSTRVAFVDPVIDPSTRTAEVRLVVDNPTGDLRPGLFVEAVIQAATRGGTLDVPASAPLFAGDRALIYVEMADADRPRYAPRPVRLGERRGDRWVVLSGLSEGERVVSEGAFVLDADLQIRGGDSLMTLPDADERPTPPMLLELSGEEQRWAKSVVVAYLDLTSALANDDLEAARETLRALAERTKEHPMRLSEVGRKLNLAARPAPSSLLAARARLLVIDPLMQDVLRRTGNPTEAPIRVAYCPMADGDQGASWLQRGEDVENAYFGEEMYRCGEIRQSLAPGDRPAAVTKAVER